MKKYSAGFSFVATLLLLVSIGIVIGVSYIAYDKFFSDNISEMSETVKNDNPVTVDDLPNAPEQVVDNSDLDEVIETLDSINLDESELDAIQTELDSF